MEVLVMVAATAMAMAMETVVATAEARVAATVESVRTVAGALARSLREPPRR